MKIPSKNKTVIYIIVFVIIAVGNFYYFRRNFSEQEQGQTDLSLANLEQQISSQYSINSRNSVLENKLFLELKKFGDWPIEMPQETGRINPFLPFYETGE